MNDEPLTPAKRDEIQQAAVYALAFDDRGKPHRMARDAMTRLGTDQLVRHLERSGFVVIHCPPAKPHSTHGGAS